MVFGRKWPRQTAQLLLHRLPQDSRSSISNTESKASVLPRSDGPLSSDDFETASFAIVLSKIIRRLWVLPTTSDNLKKTTTERQHRFTTPTENFSKSL